MKNFILILFILGMGNVAFAQWTTSGTDIYNSNAGNVGIGTTSPFARLHVQDGTNTGSIALGHYNYPGLIYSSAASGEFRIDNRSSFIGYITFYPNGQSTTVGSEAMRINSSGNVGIGTTDPQGYKLAVNGNVVAESVKVKLHTNWPDYVFHKNYSLTPLSEVEKYVQVNNHLPEIPSAEEVKKDGLNLGEMNAKLLQKIEELTLYLIDQNKKQAAMINEVKQLKFEINQLKSKP